MPVILSPQTKKSSFEVDHFEKIPASLTFIPRSLDRHLGQQAGFTQSDVRALAGGVGGGSIRFKNVTAWGNTGYDKPLPGLYFFTSHQKIIMGENVIGLCHTKGQGYSVYIKDVFFNDNAETGVAALMLARLVRFCIEWGIPKINLLAAGGRTWPDIMDDHDRSLGRWGGYYFWARCGFNMKLLQDDISMFPMFNHPSYLATCVDVQSMLKDKGGIEWWKVCGTGDFMEFDCSSETTASVAALESYLLEKGI